MLTQDVNNQIKQVKIRYILLAKSSPLILMLLFTHVLAHLSYHIFQHKHILWVLEINSFEHSKPIYV